MYISEQCLADASCVSGQTKVKTSFVMSAMMKTDIIFNHEQLDSNKAQVLMLVVIN